MELVEGPTLAERILQGPIPLEEALSIAKRIADPCFGPKPGLIIASGGESRDPLHRWFWGVCRAAKYTHSRNAGTGGLGHLAESVIALLESSTADVHHRRWKEEFRMRLPCGMMEFWSRWTGGAAALAGAAGYAGAVELTGA